MTERWSDRLRGLDGVGPRPDAWENARERADRGRGRDPIGPRLAAAAIALLILGGIVYSGWSTLSNREPATRPIPGPTSTPDTLSRLRVACTAEGAVIKQKTAVIERDGLHIRLANPIGATLLEVRSERQGKSMLFEVEGVPSANLTSVSPTGIIQVSCHKLSGEGRTERIGGRVEVEVIDPENNWPPIERVLRCADPPPKSIRPPSGRIDPADLRGELLLTVMDADEDWDIYTASADGSGAVPLIDRAVRDFDAEWSPDGERIVFVTAPDFRHTIAVASADGSNIVQLTDGSSSNDMPTWSPDGEWIYFRSNRANFGLFKMRPDGSKQQRVHELPASGVGGVSPDGRQVSVSQEFKPELELEHGPRCRFQEVVVADLETGDGRRLTFDASADSVRGWSPDGRSILFERSHRDDTAWDLYVMDVEASRETRLTASPGFDGGGVWSPDGSMIAFSSGRGRAPVRPHVMTSDGSRVARIDIELDSEIHVDDWR